MQPSSSANHAHAHARAAQPAPPPSPQVDDALLRRYAALLTPKELAAADEAGDPSVRKQRVLARALQRCTLARYLPGADPGGLAFGSNGNGKPFLVEGGGGGNGSSSSSSSRSRLEFNMSHTSSLLGALSFVVPG